MAMHTIATSNPPTRLDVIEEARRWIGTPFQHQGRIQGMGVDCVGLIIGIAHGLGFTDFDYIHYGHCPDGILLKQLLEAHLIPIPLDRVQPADILLLRFDSHPQHVALRSDIGIIHAYAQVRRCVEHRLDAVWQSRCLAAYAYPALVKE